jgi:hypothetical protein
MSDGTERAVTVAVPSVEFFASLRCRPAAI